MARTLILLAALLTATAYGSDAVDRYVKREMKRLHIPGVSLAIMRHGVVVKAKSYGFADLEHGVPVTNRSAFMIGSVSKQFEAAAILSLVEKKRLKLDDPIADYLDNLPKAWEFITIRHLLTHTSGLKDYTDLPEHDSGQAEPVKAQDLIRFVARYPLEFEPGSKYSYSNTGSYLEAMIIEKLTGMSYENFARTRLWLPAGLRSTRINRWSDVVPNRVRGYVWHGGAQHHPDFEDDSWPWAGGGCISTLEDLTTWMRKLEQGHVVSGSSLKELWSTTALKAAGRFPIGLDWFLSDMRGRPRIYRTGQIGGFSACLVRYPDADLDIIFLCNQDGIATPRLAAAIAGLVDPNLAPVPTMASTDPDPVVTDHIRRGVEDLGSGAASSKWLTPGLIASTTAQRRALIAASLKAGQTWQFLGRDDLRRRPIDSMGSKAVEIRHYSIRFAGLQITEGFYLDAAGRIAYVMDE